MSQKFSSHKPLTFIHLSKVQELLHRPQAKQVLRDVTSNDGLLKVILLPSANALISLTDNNNIKFHIPCGLNLLA
jgi:hypothetical protein